MPPNPPSKTTCKSPNLKKIFLGPPSSQILGTPLYENGFGDVWETVCQYVNHSLFIQQFEQRLKDAFRQSCVSNMETSNRCLLYRTLCREFSMASYLYKIHIPANRKAMTKFRLNSHKLMVERGRWLKVPRTDRLCVCSRAPNRGGGWGVATPPPEFWMEGLNTCQPPLILRRFLLGEVGSP